MKEGNYSERIELSRETAPFIMEKPQKLIPEAQRP